MIVDSAGRSDRVNLDLIDQFCFLEFLDAEIRFFCSRPSRCRARSLGACASSDEIAAFVESYLAKSPAQALSPGGSMADALCTQAKLAAALEPHKGPVIGYKAGLTSKAAQERFGASEPVQGLLYRNMMLEDGAVIDVPWGAVPMVEADLVLEVKDAGINAAATPQQVLAHVSASAPSSNCPIWLWPRASL